MRTEYLTLDGGSSDPDKIERAIQLLKAGELAAIPTETIYGLAGDAANPIAIAKLAKLKQRGEHDPMTLLVPSIRAAEKENGSFPRIAQKLARIYWPGPLTIVLFNTRNNGLPQGYRLPAHPVARAILAGFGRPLAVPGGGKPGYPDPTTAQQVREQLDGHIALILDAGPTRYKTPSTVVRVNGEAVTLLRAGVIDRGELLDNARPTILFACTGNTCRSPMAAGFCLSAIHEPQRVPTLGLLQNEPDGLPFRVLSAGTNTIDGKSADRQAIQVMKEVGIDVAGHITQGLTPNLVDGADWIFTMTRAHRESILALMPHARDRVQLLSTRMEDIPDPASRSIEHYRLVRDKIAVCLRDVVKIVKGVGKT